MSKKSNKKKFEYSKLIIVYETILVGIITIGVLLLVGFSIANSFDGAFPYLTTMVSVAWAAYGTSTGFYYNKAKTENKIKLLGKGADKDVVMAEPYIETNGNSSTVEANSSNVNNNVENLIIDELEEEGILG